MSVNQAAQVLIVLPRRVKKLIVFPAVYMMLLIAAEIFLKPVNIYLLNLIHIVIITVLAYSFFRNELKWENIRTALKK